MVLVPCLTLDDGTAIDRCYTRNGIGRTYFDAQEFCKEKGGYVMEINSADEESLVTGFLIGSLHFTLNDFHLTHIIRIKLF